MLIGYGRISTAEQRADHQRDALIRAGVAERDVHIDVASGAKATRPQLDLVLRIAREGDTLVITRLDRLGRSMLHLVTLGAELRERGIGLKVIEQGIDTDTPEGRAMFGMLSVLAEFQRELIVANTHDGLAAARARGRRGGRPSKLSPDQAALAQRLYDEGAHTVQQIADIVGAGRTTVYGHLAKNTDGTRPRAGARPGSTASPDTVRGAEPRIAVEAAAAPPEPVAAAPAPEVVQRVVAIEAITAPAVPAPEPATAPRAVAEIMRPPRGSAGRGRARRADPCPTCGTEPSQAYGPLQLAADVAFRWYELDTSTDNHGGLIATRHCAECQPTQRFPIACADPDCEEGPLLGGELAAQARAASGRVPEVVLRLLTGRGWSTDGALLCPDHG
ncbi:recombinase family protein [Nocardia asteroides]|uniref:recombinase family protein n=1 Tax=Nocardia asteroides TaxID=1824 RepID=UPI001E394889|nr:recombinase family protein [Nocardia asteroides]UGT59136.1 recombinase family protein [Nocardia asteroides]